MSNKCTTRRRHVPCSLLHTPTNPGQCLWYCILTSMCMFTTLTNIYLIACPLPHTIYVPVIITSALRHRTVCSFPRTIDVPIPIEPCLTYHWYLQFPNANVHTCFSSNRLLIMVTFSYYTYIKLFFCIYSCFISYTFDLCFITHILFPPLCCFLQRC